MTRQAALVLVGTPIGNLGDLTRRAIEELQDADVVAAEDTRRARKLLSAAGVAARGRLLSVHAHNEAEMARRVVERVREGARVAYVSDAGMPGIADPGERLVRACVEAGLTVEVVPGPSAALTGLVVSGLPTDRFVFEGFLPRKGRRRAERLQALEREERTVVVFESPHRLTDTLRDLADALGPDRGVVVAREMTKLHEEVWRGRLADAGAHVGREPRGEYVLVLAPGAAPSAVASEDVEHAIADAMEAGLSARDAAADVAGRLGVSRNAAYRIAVALRRGAEPT